MASLCFISHDSTLVMLQYLNIWKIVMNKYEVIFTVIGSVKLC